MPCPHGHLEEDCPECSRTHLRKGGDKSAPEPAGADAPRLAPGARISRYVILEVLGEGGMGLVYAAFDPQLDRKVAIKVLRSTPGVGTGQTGGQARLLREAQAMAQLAHPNVVPVYDVGTLGDSVFVAMEFVRGVTLNPWLRAKPRSWREILEVFLAAGEGLEAAHGAGLIHRDFKPGNVLVGEDGRVRITDFGLARSTRSPAPTELPTLDLSQPLLSASSPSLETPLTLAGSIMGSPGYMAPEQYLSTATSGATDQFAYCVSLYEALYGERPYAGATLEEAFENTTLGRLRPPPKAPHVPARIQALLLKGLAVDPLARFPSMSVLLAELAKDPAATRRRWAVGIGVALALIGAATAVTLKLRAQENLCRGSRELLAGRWDAAVKARAAAAFTATGKSYAPEAWQHAQAAMDAYAENWVALRGAACEGPRLQGEAGQREVLLKLACFDRRLEELGSLAGAFTTSDADVVERATAAVGGLSSLEACKQLKAGQDATAHFSPEQRSELQQLRLDFSQGRGLLAAGRYGPAREKLAPAADRAPRFGLHGLVAETQLALGELEIQTAHFDKARAALERAVAEAEADGDDERAARALVALVSLVGYRLESPEQGRTLAALTRGILQRLGGNDLLEGQLFEGMGDTEWQDGNRQTSIDDYRAALGAYVRARGPDSEEAARMHLSMGWVFTELGQLEEAKRALERARSLQERLLGPKNPAVSQTWNALGTLATRQGDVEAAVRAFETTREIREQALGPDNYLLTAPLVNEGCALSRAGRAREALPLLDRADAVLAKQSTIPATGQVEQWTCRAHCLGLSGRGADAQALARKTLAYAEIHLGKEHAAVAMAAEELGEELLDGQGYGEALVLCDRSAAIHAKGGDRWEQAEALTCSGRALEGLGQWSAARERLEQARSTYAHLQGDPASVAEADFELAKVLARTRSEQPQARELARTALEAYQHAHREPEARRVTQWIEQKR